MKTSNTLRPTVSQIEEELRRRRDIGKSIRTMRNIVILLIVVACVTVLVAMLWLPVMQVHGTSMEPVLKDGEILLAVRGQSRIEHNDIVAFYYNNQVLLKRAIGLPGDTINIDKDGDVYVNGEFLDEPYISKKSIGICDITFPVTVPENSVFVMGDKRAVSVDSRSSDVGMIYSERTIGKIVFRVWGFESFGPVLGH